MNAYTRNVRVCTTCIIRARLPSELVIIREVKTFVSIFNAYRVEISFKIIDLK